MTEWQRWASRYPRDPQAEPLSYPGEDGPPAHFPTRTVGGTLHKYQPADRGLPSCSCGTFEPTWPGIPWDRQWADHIRTRRSHA